MAGAVSDEGLLSPDGRLDLSGSRVLYLADRQTDEVLELYSVPVEGGLTTKLNGNLVSQGDVSTFEMNPNSHWVVYRADQRTDEKHELFSSYNEMKIYLPMIRKS